MNNQNINDIEKLIAIYTRKSKFTGHGESIDNQIEMCKQSLINKYGEEILNKIVVYEDEGFTGANINRPRFQKMLTEFEQNKYSMLVVYRLDRVSRNVADFCGLIEQLNDWNIAFMSITESFDTSTPMGKAMLMITSVFAQLERDTIAERIKDNMHELAKTGRWLGGTTPLGYISKKIESTSIDGKKKGLYQLTIDEENMEKTKLLFNKYLELKSISKLEAYTVKNNIKTRKGIYFSRFALSTILRNLVYCKADEDIKEFLETLGVKVFDNNLPFDGTYGLISYNKRIQKKSKNGKIRKNEVKDITEWVVAIGKHSGIIDGKDWISIWNNLETRTYNKRTQKSNAKIEALLSGILRCECGSFMRPKVLKTCNEKGMRNFSYTCELKSKSQKVHCDSNNINGIETDIGVLNILKTIYADETEVISILKNIVNGKKAKTANNKDLELQSLTGYLNNNNKKIKGLLEKLSLIDIEMTSIITDEIKRLQNKNIDIELKIKDINKRIENTEKIKDMSKLTLDIMNHYLSNFKKINIDTQRKLVKLLVSNIKFDGKDIIIELINTSDDSNTFYPIDDNWRSEQKLPIVFFTPLSM